MKRSRWVRTAAAAAAAVFLGLGSTFTVSAAAGDEIRRVERSVEIFRELADLPEEGLPEVLLRRVEGIAIFPGVVKIAYGIGGQYGKGILLIRREDGDWSHPCFVKMAGGSLGWQIGVQKTDFVLIFKSRKSLRDIDDGKITLGADVSVAAGPMGRSAEASTDLEMEAEILSYSKSRGLFAGVSIKGATIFVDEEANQDFYGRRRIDAETILGSRRLDAPPVVERLWRILERYTRRSGRF